MIAVLAAVCPVFALIGAGVAFGRLRRIDARGVAVLNAFVVWLAVPALLFQSLAEHRGLGAIGGGFLIAFGGGMAATFLLGLMLRRGAGLDARALGALAGSYSNTAFLGIPLMHALMGPEGAAAAVIASILTVSALFGVTILLIEVARDRGRPAGAMMRVGAALLRNPLILAPLAGAAWALSGAAIPGPAAQFLTLFATAASPCALVTIGAFLALPGRGAAPGPLVTIVALKLAAQPALTALVILLLGRMGRPPAQDVATAAILIAALPTGTGPFMLAELYGGEAALASRAILVTTLIGTASVSLLAVLLR